MTQTRTYAAHTAPSRRGSGTSGLSAVDTLAAQHYVRSTLAQPPVPHSFSTRRTPTLAGAHGHPRDMSDRPARALQKVVTQLLEQLELEHQPRLDSLVRQASMMEEIRRQFGLTPSIL
jgi:hypothetical protein